MPKLKNSIKLLEEFIAKWLPEIKEYLEKNKILVEYFSISWFLTIFSYDLALSADKENHKMLNQIWDFFFLFGWKWIFQISLAFMHHSSPQLLKLDYESALSYLKDIIRVPKWNIVCKIKSFLYVFLEGNHY
jgi:hypothetical protein